MWKSSLLLAEIVALEPFFSSLVCNLVYQQTGGLSHF